MLLGRLLSGEEVIRAHRTELSRPGLEALVLEALPRIEARGRHKIIKTLNFLRIIGTMPLLKTKESDEIVYATRRGMKFPTRFVKSRQPEPTSHLTVILHKYEDRRTFWLDTAFTGKMKHFVEPNEGDKFAPRGYERDLAKRYWAERAWAWEPHSIMPGSETTVCPW